MGIRVKTASGTSDETYVLDLSGLGASHTHGGAGQDVQIALPPKTNTVAVTGDSISQHGMNGVVPTSLGSQGYLNWASMLSGGRIKWAGSYATSGFTTAQILATHLPQVIAANPRPGACIVLGGTNDVGNAVPLSTSKANLTAIYTALSGAGIIPVLCTIPPRNDFGSVVGLVSQLNAWIVRYAHQQGFPLIDFFSGVTSNATWPGPLVAPATSGWATNMNADTVHPSDAGARVMGQLLADKLAPLLPQVTPWHPGGQAVDTAQLVANALFLTDTNADGVPDGWGISGTGATSSLATATGVLGNVMTLTCGNAGSPAILDGPVFAVTAGDVIQVTAKIAATLEASGGIFQLTVVKSDFTATLLDYGTGAAWNKDIPAFSTVDHELTIPTTGSYKVRLTARSAVGAVAKIAQLGVVNLTASSILT